MIVGGFRSETKSPRDKIQPGYFLDAIKPGIFLSSILKGSCFCAELSPMFVCFKFNEGDPLSCNNIHEKSIAKGEYQENLRDDVNVTVLAQKIGPVRGNNLPIKVDLTSGLHFRPTDYYFIDGLGAGVRRLV